MRGEERDAETREESAKGVHVTELVTCGHLNRSSCGVRNHTQCLQETSLLLRWPPGAISILPGHAGCRMRELQRPEPWDRKVEVPD